MKAAKVQAFVLFILGMGLALLLDIYMFIFVVSLVLLSHQYSMGPLKLDGRPFFSQLFWVVFAILYYLTISAYLVRYDDVSSSNILNGFYFLSVMVLFVAIAETLAKDLRDLDNDRGSGKRTTPVRIGSKKSAIASFIFSFFGIFLWAYPFFGLYETPFFLKIVISALLVIWNLTCLYLCWSIFKRYTKEKARQLHIGYLLTLTCILAITFIAGVY